MGASKLSRRCVFGLAAVALLLSGAGLAQASAYLFTYSDPAGNVADGLLFADPPPISGPVVVTGGYMNLTSTSNNALALGTYQWLAASAGPFLNDNLLFPANDAIGVAPPSYLTFFGVLFGPGPAPNPLGTEINIWGNGGANSYSFWGAPGGAGYDPQIDIGTFQIVEYVPEPASLAVWSVVGLTVGAVGWWRRRRQA